MENLDAKYCKTCDRVLTLDSFLSNGKHPTCRECRNKTTKRHYDSWRERAIATLGGKCLGCGENDSVVLTFDHMNGDGAEDRRKEGHSSRRLYREIVEGREDIQLLCFNCNHRKRIEEQEHREAAKPVVVIPDDHPDAIAARAWASGGFHEAQKGASRPQTSKQLEDWWGDPANQEQIKERNERLSKSRAAVGNQKLRDQADERNKERNAEILRLRKQGQTYDEIAKRVGCSKPVVAKIIKRLAPQMTGRRAPQPA